MGGGHRTSGGDISGVSDPRAEAIARVACGDPEGWGDPKGWKAVVRSGHRAVGRSARLAGGGAIGWVRQHSGWERTTKAYVGRAWAVSANIWLSDQSNLKGLDWPNFGWDEPPSSWDPRNRVFTKLRIVGQNLAGVGYIWGGATKYGGGGLRQTLLAFIKRRCLPHLGWLDQFWGGPGHRDGVDQTWGGIDKTRRR